MTDQQYAPAPPARDPQNLQRPLYGATFGEALKRFFGNYFHASARASQSEYWWALLATAIVLAAGIIPAVIGSALGEGVGEPPAASTVLLILGGAVALTGGVVFGIGSISLSIRRLHDANVSGWWYLPVFLVNLIPVVGILAYVAMIVIGLLPSKPEGIRFDKA